MTLYEPASGVSTPTRHAALLLHAMAPADRTWALERLPPVQREQLTALVEELQQIGIPRNRGLVDQAVASMQSPSPTQQVSTSEPPPTDLPLPVRQLLTQLDADGRRELGVLLRNEPPMLVARLLALGPWPWENELLAHLGSVKRRQLETLRITPGPDHGANAMSNAILGMVGTHLCDALQQAPQRQAAAMASLVSAGKKPRWSRSLMSVFRQTGKVA
jgi:hypothetical protein